VIFEQIRNEGCLSYLIGCEHRCVAAIVDPKKDEAHRLLAAAQARGLRIRFVIDTHTHADHFTATRDLATSLEVPVVMHRASAAPFVDLRVDDGEVLIVGDLRLELLHTPGHTNDSMCVRIGGNLLTGDTLLIQATGRTDLPTGDPEALHDSLFGVLARLPRTLGVFPAHDYRDRGSSTLEAEFATNPRLQVSDRTAFVEKMRALDLGMPTHLTEALRTNRSGGKTVSQMLGEATARVPFMSMQEVRQRAEAGGAGFVVLDVREADAYRAGHIPGARHVPRGQLELRVNDEFPDPTVRIVLCCELGLISTLATATLRDMGFRRAVALDGGMKGWREAGLPLETAAPGAPPER
jgi:glyoxylase-like metal-dependent hydrolase (beta-lactamase superfamily II)/rhodanese-related sulfurtransferase